MRSFFRKTCSYYLLSLLIYESGRVGRWWQYVFLFREVHMTVQLFALASQSAKTKHTQLIVLILTDPSIRRCPQIKVFESWVFDWRMVSRVQHNPAISGPHQVRGCTEANRRSKCTSPLCCVAHYVVSVLILHKWDVRHRLPAQSISLPCNTHRHKMVLMPRLSFSPPSCDPQFLWPESHCRRWQQKKGQWECVCEGVNLICSGSKPMFKYLRVTKQNSHLLLPWCLELNRGTAADASVSS